MDPGRITEKQKAESRKQKWDPETFLLFAFCFLLCDTTPAAHARTH
jgi:hypothetical protein